MSALNFRRLSIALLATLFFSATVSSARAVSFMLDLEVAGFAPGQAGGKFVNATFDSQVIAINAYMLFQGTDGTASNDSIKAASGYVRSSSGGLRGNVANFEVMSDYTPAIFGHGYSGTSLDFDGDGDLDLGSPSVANSQFMAATDIMLDHGFGPACGSQDGTVAAAALGRTGADYAYALIGTFEFSLIDPVSGGGSTLLQMYPRLNSSNNSLVQINSLQGHENLTGQIGNFNVSGSASEVLQGAPVVISAGSSANLVVTVPEPATWIMACLGLVPATILALRRRKS